MTLRARAGDTVLAILIGFDQWLQTLLVAPFALAGLAKVPDPDATISGLLGAHAGRTWALLPISLVDALFLVLTLGRERDHCARTAARESQTCSG